MGVVGRSAAGGFAVGFACGAALIILPYLTGHFPLRTLPYGAILAAGLGVVGGAPTALVGLLVGLGRHHSRIPRPVDMWADPVERCAESTRHAAADVMKLPRSPARDRLRAITDRMARELDDVRGVAQLGRALGAVDREHPVYLQLRSSARNFTAFERQLYLATRSVRDDPTYDLSHLEQRVSQLSG